MVKIKFKQAKACESIHYIASNEHGFYLTVGIIERQSAGWKSRPTVYTEFPHKFELFQVADNLAEIKRKIKSAVAEAIEESGAL